MLQTIIVFQRKSFNHIDFAFLRTCFLSCGSNTINNASYEMCMRKIPCDKDSVSTLKSSNLVKFQFSHVFCRSRSFFPRSRSFFPRSRSFFCRSRTGAGGEKPGVCTALDNDSTNIVYFCFFQWRFLDEKPIPVIWLLSFLILFTLNILSVIKDASRGCTSTTCIVFYVLGCSGAVLGIIFLWFWAKKSAVYFKKLLILNQDWLLDENYCKTNNKGRTLNYV